MNGREGIMMMHVDQMTYLATERQAELHQFARTLHLVRALTGRNQRRAATSSRELGQPACCPAGA
jgi:hypothetical protein